MSIFKKMKSVSRPISCAFRSRAYSAHAAPKQADTKLSFPAQDAKVTRLPSGVVVATLENYSPVTSLAVLYNAGPRYESAQELGISHSLRMAASQSTEKSTQFSVAKNLQQVGASLTCTSTREQMIYAVQCLRGHVSTGLDYLNQVATSPAFKSWELDDAKARLKVDLEVYQKNSRARLMDAIHKVAFRDTLGNSLFMNADRVGSFTPELLESYVQSRYVSFNAAVAGIGVDHEALVQAARKMTFKQGNVEMGKKAKFHSGGDLRIDSSDKLVHAAVVSEGVSIGSADVVTAYVVQQALGGTPFVQYGLNASSRLNKAAATVTNQPYSVNSLSLSYSDAGLFGFQAVASYNDIGKVLRAVISALKQASKNGFTEADVKRAKAQVKLLILSEAETAPLTAVESLGVQAVLSGQAMSASQLAALVDKVTVDDVNRVSKTLLGGKPCMAAVGHLVNTPYLDEIL